MKNELDFFRGNFWNPMREFSELQRGINHLFDDFGWMSPHRKGTTELAFAPACDIEETEGQYLMHLDLPGVKKEDVKVELIDRDLVISGERNEEKKEDKKSRYVVERYHGSFRRVITLPAAIPAEQIQASFENGVLKLAVPKAEATKTKQIKITDGKTTTSSSSASTPQKTEAKDGRVITLPAAIPAEQIQASFENGVLKLAVPKAEATKTKQIKITDGKTTTSSSSASTPQKTEAKTKENNSTVRVA